MHPDKKLIEVLTDLVEINYDRVAGYEKAAEESKNLDADLQSIFNNMANDSKRYAAELTQEVNKLGGSTSGTDTKKGKIHQVWMDVKAAFSGYDRQAILESCDFGEDAVQREYNMALAGYPELDARIRTIITNQKTLLKSAHKLVKNYRDAHWKMLVFVSFSANSGAMISQAASWLN